MTTPHPQLQAILQRQQANPPPAPESLPIAKARANFERNNLEWNTPLPPMEASELVVGNIRCKLLSPKPKPDGFILFVHGGGWTFGSSTTHERFARLLAQHSGAAVLMPDYRLAPEHPAPAAIEDILAVIANLDNLVPPGAKMALCGDSAGANIALAVALERPSRPIAMLSLLYGCFAPIFDTDSHLHNGDGRFGLSTARMQWYWKNWLGSGSDPRAIPLDGTFKGLSRCHLLAAALDPLCDDSFLLARRLTDAGVPFRLDVIPGVNHGFLQLSAQLDPAMDATGLIAAEIAASL